MDKEEVTNVCYGSSPVVFTSDPACKIFNNLSLGAGMSGGPVSLIEVEEKLFDLQLPIVWLQYACQELLNKMVLLVVPHSRFHDEIRW